VSAALESFHPLWHCAWVGTVTPSATIGSSALAAPAPIVSAAAPSTASQDVRRIDLESFAIRDTSRLQLSFPPVRRARGEPERAANRRIAGKAYGFWEGEDLRPSMVRSSSVSVEALDPCG